VVTRASIDVLRSARVRREAYVGQWFPEPLLTDPYEGVRSRSSVQTFARVVLQPTLPTPVGER
jgi:hypothetical protein